MLVGLTRLCQTQDQRFCGCREAETAQAAKARAEKEVAHYRERADAAHAELSVVKLRLDEALHSVQAEQQASLIPRTSS